MTHARDMIRTHPAMPGPVSEELVRFLEACFACAQACTACADACLGEESVADLRQCIRLDLDCADLCVAGGKLASRHTGKNLEVLREALRACATAARACGDECEKHGDMHEHCRVCAEACRRCEVECRQVLRQIA